MTRIALAALAACLSVATLCHATARDDAFNGVWVLDSKSQSMLHDASGQVPPLNAVGKTLYQQRRAQLAAGDTSFDASAKCKPMGFPRVLWDGGPFDIQLQPKLVFFGYTWNRNHRTADFRDALPPLQIPRYYGLSAAHWDQDTLVVESAGFKDNTLLDRSGLPHSPQLALTERYRAHGDRLDVRLTVTDPTYYSQPWDVQLHYHKQPDGRIAEDICELHAPFYRGLFPGNN